MFVKTLAVTERAAQNQICHRERQTQLLTTPSYGTVYRHNFLKALLDHYLPRGSTPPGYDGRAFEMFEFDGRAVPLLCSMWLIYVCQRCDKERDMDLDPSVFAMSLGLLGTWNNDRHLLMQGLHLYQRALVRIQRKLDNGPETAVVSIDELSVFLSSLLACAITELLVNHSPPNFWRHIDGIATLIGYCDSSSLTKSYLSVYLL